MFKIFSLGVLLCFKLLGIGWKPRRLAVQVLWFGFWVAVDLGLVFSLESPLARPGASLWVLVQSSIDFFLGGFGGNVFISLLRMNRHVIVIRPVDKFWVFAVGDCLLTRDAICNEHMFSVQE